MKAAPKSLSKDLTTRLIYIVLVIFAVTSLFSLWFYSSESKKSYLATHAEYLAYLSDNLQVPLWNIDRDWIASICTTFARNEVVSLLRVAGEDGDELFSMVNEHEPSLVVNRRPVYYKGILVGTVELGFTALLYRKSNNEMFFRSILPMLFVIFGLMIANSLLFSRLVGKPLNHLMSRIEDISAGNYSDRNSTFEHAEIENILEKFNDMATQVEKREVSLLAANKQLESEIAERQLAERRRIESDRRYQQLVEELPVGVFRSSADYDGGYSMVNPAFVKMLGHGSAEEMLGKSVKNVYRDPLMRDIFVEMLHREGTIRGLVLEFKKSDNRSLTALVTAHLVTDGQGRPQYVEGIVEDITERSNLEKQMRQAQKMEAIGTLAGGIAHDFNNILASIFGFTEAARMRYGKGENVDKYFSEILDAGLRARSLIKQMLTFSRQTEVNREAISIGPIIKETIQFLRASLPAMIDIKWSLAADNGVVLADPTHIHQILMNLCTNSAHAMREKGGMLEIFLDDLKVVTDGGCAEPFAGLPPGDYLQLSVVDNGHGISPEIQERIFEPFFTTKPRGEGTGMGLAVIHGLIRDMGGAISVVSRSDEGAAFHVCLPKYAGPGLDHGKGEPTAPAAGSARILLVDDEEGFRSSSREVLEQLGYQVAIAADGLEAYDIFMRRPHFFDLVITDLAMPKMTGLELTRRLKEKNPALPVILCTGHNEGLGEGLHHGLSKGAGKGLNSTGADSRGFHAILLKPVLAKELTAAIQGVLAAGGGGQW